MPDVPAGWTETNLGEVVELKRGYDLPKRLREEGEVPIISSSGLSGTHNESKVTGSGVVTGRYGTIGEVHWVDEAYWPLNTALYVRDFKGNDRKFIYYFLQLIDYFAYSDKAAVPGVNRNHLHKAEVCVPPLPEQRAIASILGALDDKIELNRRMNATLESLARAIFKSWFVDFDPVKINAGQMPASSAIPTTHDPKVLDLFPSTFQDSELGPIPEGWEVTTVGDVTHRVTKGDTPRKAALAAAPDDDSMVNMLRVNAITEVGEILRDKLLEIPESIHLGKSKRSILAPNYILYTNAGTIGRVALVQEDILPANTNQAIAIIQPDESKIDPKFLYMVVRQPEFQSELHFDVVQAVQANLALGKIAEAHFVMPPENVLTTFMDNVGNLLDSIWANRQESASLAAQRDTLLPQLLAGDVPVPEALTATEEALV